MNENLKINSIAIIGGGPAGIMSAIIASQNSKNNITIFEKKDILNTLLYTGGGRCNISYAEFDNRELTKYYPRGEKFLHSAFSQFSVSDTMEFFAQKGIHLYIQDDCRIFPESNKAQDVQEVLLKSIQKENIEIKKEEVINIEYVENKFKIISSKSTKIFDSLIISSGGRGNGHNFAKSLSHTITPLKPSLCGLIVKDQYLKALSGLTLKNLSADIYFENKKIFTQYGDLLFTHFGVSGPIIYKISSYSAFLNYTKENPLQIKLNLVSENESEFEKIFLDSINKNSKKEIINILTSFIPRNLAKAILHQLNIDEHIKASVIDKTMRKEIIKNLCNFTINAVSPIPNGEVVTAGGVKLDEINPKTMESKLIKRLFFCGEILDIDGLTGGFNLQNCWTTGYIAGKSLL